MSNAASSGEEPIDSQPEGGMPAINGERRGVDLVPLPFTLGTADGGFAEARVEAPARRDGRRWRGAASIAAVVLIGAAAVAAQVHAERVAHAERAETHALARQLDSIAASLQSLDAKGSRDDLAVLKKSLAEFKASAASARDLGGAVAQLSARVDRLEKDQTSRIDKLGDKLDKDAAQQLAGIAQRLEKLEAKPAAVAAPKPEPAKAEPARGEPAVSMETTGSIEKAKPRLHNFFLSEIHNGYAMIDGPGGEFAVVPGDVVPGGGRVLRIERHGHDWVVVTTLGQIASAGE